MKKKITIKDVAERLKVTISTVSRALHDHHTISEKTKKLVRKMAEELNYSPNKIAASLRKGTGNTIGVIVPRINSNFHSNCIFGMESITDQAGYNLIICQSNEDLQKEIHSVQTLIDSQVSGIIISLSNNTKNSTHIKKIIDKEIPLVMYDRIDSSLNIDFIVNDDYSISKEAIKHFVNQGYRKIAILCAPTHVYVYKNRLNGYLNSLKDLGVENKDEWIVTDVLSKEDAYIATKGIFNHKDCTSPDAIFCSSDMFALGAIQALKEMGLKIPEDVGIIGYGNDPFSELIKPSLTTIEQFPQDVGANAAEIMIDLLTERKKTTKTHKKILITPILIIRESSIKNL